ncbi:MAG: hypothetical protein ACHQFZ_04150 [Acidimicrobiales bacterium]
MSNQLSDAPGHETTPVTPIRRPASGPCKCTRRTCWHQHDCRASGVVRILRAVDPKKKTPSSVVLCRECAIPTRRNRVA